MSKEISEIINLLKLKKLAQAEKKCLKLIKSVKENFEIINVYAVILFQLKKYDEAILEWKKCIKLNPSYHFGFNNLGNVFLIQNDLDSALENYNKAIELNPNYYEALYNKGNIYLKLKDFTKALENYNKVLVIKNDYAPAHQGKAIIFKKLLKFKEAIDEWQKVFEINPANTNALVQMGDLLFDTNQLDKALKAYNEALIIDPNKPFLMGSIVHTKTKMCEWNNFEEDRSNLKKKILGDEKGSSPYTTLTIFDDPEIHFKSANVWSREHLKQEDQKTYTKFEKLEKNKKIKIGYYSADFRTHAMGHLLVRMFELHDKEKFEIYGFYFGPTIKENDNLAKRIIKSFDKFTDVTSKSDIEVAEVSRSIGIDIAVDLMCFTGTHNRFGIFTEKCAPLQINFLGYPGTSGSNYINYIVIDKNLKSEDNKKFFSENLISLPDSYQPNEEKKEISGKIFTKEELNLPISKFIFACFNSHQKIMPEMFKVWMSILRSKKDSVLWLLEDNIFSHDNLKKEANKLEVDPQRIIFAKNLPFDQHLSRIRHTDLFLDTFPYNAHTTCSDALREGLPVLTLRGKSFASRVASSLLTTMNLQELITTNYENYEKLAIKISSDPDYLKNIKEKIKKNKLETNLFKSKVFTKNLENGYIKVFQNYIEGNKTKNFEL